MRKREARRERSHTGEKSELLEIEMLLLLLLVDALGLAGVEARHVEGTAAAVIDFDPSTYVAPLLTERARRLLTVVEEPIAVGAVSS